MISEKLETELARLLFKQAPFVSISLYFLLAIVIYFFWGTLPVSVLVVWSAVNLTLATSLLALTRRYHAETKSKDGGQWIRNYTFLAFFQDMSWGMIGPLSFLTDNAVYHMLTLFMLGGMAAGGIATRAVVFETYVVSLLSLLSPIIIAMVFIHDDVPEGMLPLTIVFLLFMLSVAKNYSKSIMNNVLLWLDNEHLISDLVASKKEIEDTNTVLINEIENRLKTEEELVLAKEHAEQASAAKNQFLANISHELRTPLNGILGFNAVLKKAELDDESRLYVGQIEKSSQTLLNLVNDILDITSIEAGHLKLCERDFSLRGELGDVIAVAQTVASNKTLTVQCDVAEGVPDILYGDPDRLKQILHNIIGNAIKYTEQGVISVRVSSVLSEELVDIGFEVEDSGEGIPESVRHTLFDNFTQGDGFERKKSEGVGLGLAIVKNLLDKMGGTIDFDTAEGKGSLFRVHLPFKQGTALSAWEEDRKGNEPVDIHQDNTAEKGLRVLVVDDNDSNRLVLASFLKQLGIAYEEAATGNEALEKIRTDFFDVVLLDIQMPEISGLEVASNVAQMEGKQPSMVAITAHAFPQQREEILQSGFVDCLIKPIVEEDLIRVLRRSLKSTHLPPN